MNQQPTTYRHAQCQSKCQAETWQKKIKPCGCLVKCSIALAIQIYQKSAILKQ